MAYYIYVLRCKGDTLYTGITPDLRRRMRQHCGQLAGGAKYTHSHKPEALLRVWETVDHTAAARFECAFKQLTRIQKEQLLQIPEQWDAVLSLDAAPAAYAPIVTPQLCIETLPLADYLRKSTPKKSD